MIAQIADAIKAHQEEASSLLKDWEIGTFQTTLYSASGWAISVMIAISDWWVIYSATNGYETLTTESFDEFVKTLFHALES